MAYTSSLPLIEIIKRSVRERHLEQLSQLELVANPLENLPIFADLDDLIQWTKDSQKQINAGKKNSMSVITNSRR